MTRRTLPLLLALMLAGVPVVAASDTLEKVLASHYEAIGGVDAWKEVASCRMTGRMVLPTGLETPFTLTFARPFKTRLEFTVQEMTGVQIFDGEKAWAILPFTGSADPQPMPEEQARIMREQADFAGPLIDWEAKGHQIELVGKEKSDEREAYHLEVTLEGGAVRHFFLDAESYLLVRLEATMEIQGAEMDVETIFSDFRQVGELVMAHSIESKPKGAPSGQLLTMETIELDVEVSDDLFALPAAAQEEEEGEAAE